MSNGKGSAPRPINDREDFGRRWEETFSRVPPFSEIWDDSNWFDPFDVKKVYTPIVVSPPYDR